jgi:TrmH family RNA methyltransferase
MFRAAESFGAEKMWLSPLCADPRHKRAERTALGCVDIVPWARLPEEPFAAAQTAAAQVTAQGITPGQPVGTPAQAVAACADNAADFSVGPFFALETGGIPLEEFSFPSRGIMIVGSEELGVSPQGIAAADASLGRVSIPTYGAKASLNVSVAFGIVMQAWAAALSRN